MSDNNLSNQNLNEVRAARDQAEALYHQLQAEYEMVLRDEDALTLQGSGVSPQGARKIRGRQAMQKAIIAVQRAIESIDQALSDMERVDMDDRDQDNG